MKIAALVLAVIFHAGASLLFGSADVSLRDLLSLLSHNYDPGLSAIVFDIRLPRTLLALLVDAGGLLLALRFRECFETRWLIQH